MVNNKLLIKSARQALWYFIGLAGVIGLLLLGALIAHINVFLCIGYIIFLMFSLVTFLMYIDNSYEEE